MPLSFVIHLRYDDHQVEMDEIEMGDKLEMRGEIL